jgi:glycosyltransferase involved in cell wall biosynthesis
MEKFLFPVGDVRLLAEKIMQFISLNAEEVREKRIRCAIFAKKYSKGTRDRAYAALYEKLIRESQMSKSYLHE